MGYYCEEVGLVPLKTLKQPCGHTLHIYQAERKRVFIHPLPFHIDWGKVDSLVVLAFFVLQLANFAPMAIEWRVRAAVFSLALDSFMEHNFPYHLMNESE